MSLVNEEFRVVVADRAHCVGVQIEGELDCASAPRLRDALEASMASEVGDVDVDMSMTTFCDASGLTVLLAAHRHLQLAGRRLRIARASGPVLRLLDLSGTRRLIATRRPDEATPMGPRGGRSIETVTS